MTISVCEDLRGQFGAVRDQGARPTCLAFATSDAHAGMRDGWDPLSCEYVFYHAQKRRGRSPNKGAFLEDMLATLQEDGQPQESGWPYLPVLPSDLNSYRPPSAVGDLYGRTSEQPSGDVDRICSALDMKRPAIVLTKLTMAFYRPSSEGLIEHSDGDKVFPAPRHAVVAVGHGSLSRHRVVLVRNSWGSGWGLSGYGWLTEQYLSENMYGLALLQEACDVPARAAAA